MRENANNFTCGFLISSFASKTPESLGSLSGISITLRSSVDTTFSSAMLMLESSINPRSNRKTFKQVKQENAKTSHTHSILDFAGRKKTLFVFICNYGMDYFGSAVDPNRKFMPLI